MPTELRREVYEALGLGVTVSADGGMWAEARVDQTVIRYSHEVERLKRELARVRRELASPAVTDTVMAEVVS